MGKSFRDDNKHDNFRKYRRGKMKSHEAKKNEQKKGTGGGTDDWKRRYDENTYEYDDIPNYHDETYLR